MKERKKIVLSSGVMLLVSAVTMASVTFAWFTQGDTATVSGMDFTAQSQGGIQISVGAENDGQWTWKSNINADDLKKVSANDEQLTHGKLAPVSTTVDKLKEGALFKGTVSDTKLTSTDATTTSETQNGYYKFDLYFKNESDTAKDIILNTSSKSESNGVNGKTGSDKGLQNAARVAFVQIDSKEKIADLTGLTLSSTNKGTSAVIWEPNATSHTDNVKNLYPGTMSTSKLSYYGLDANGSWTLGNYDSSTGIIGLTNPSNINSSSVVTTNDGTSDITLFTIPANQTTKVSVFVWIEGQDVDCINYAATGQVETALHFTATDHKDE